MGGSGYWAVAILVVAGVVVYANSFSGTFLLDDQQNIVDKHSIRQLWPPWPHLMRPRPLVELALAVNYAVSGLDTWSYHVFNLAVHILAGLALFGVVRRTLLVERMQATFSRSATSLAFVTAIIWLVHPLQTQSVTYVIQRAESMMGLFYLTTLYCVIRGAQSQRGRSWYALSVLACTAGMSSKLVMVTAPPLVLLYDRVFLARSFGEIFRRRGWLYLALAMSWLVIASRALNILNPAPRTSSVGFGFREFSSWDYLVTQSGVILHYLRLSVWPDRLCLDYWWPVAKTPMGIIGPGFAITGLLCLTIWGFFRHTPLAFLGAAFFIILGPTSSVVPIRDIAFEHRMYLPLAAIVAIAVFAVHGGVAHVVERQGWSQRMQQILLGATAASIVLLLGWRTLARNADYQSAEVMWSKVVAQRPENHRAIMNYGLALKNAGRVEEAVSYFRKALALEPAYTKAHANLGNALLMLGRDEEAESHLKQAVSDTGKTKQDAIGYNNLGRAQAMKGRLAEAEASFRIAIALDPNYSAGYSNLGNVLADQEKYEEAVPYYEKAIALQPEHPDAYNNLATVLLAQGDVEGALENFVRAIERQPGNRNASNNLAIVLSSHGEIDVLVAKYAERVPLDGVHALAYAMQGEAYRRQERLEEARTAYERALAIDPQQKVARARLDAGLAAPAVTAPRPTAPAGLGDPAPAFKVQTVAGDRLELARLKGKVVVLDFWATWCGPCRRELPYLKSVADAFGKRDDFVLIGVSRDMNPAAFRRFIDKQGMGWHQVFGTDADALARAYGVTSIPALFVVGRDGRLAREGLRGAMMREEIGKCLGVAVAGDE